MSNFDYNVFKQLKQLNVTPPPGLWEELRLHLFENDGLEQFRQLKEYDLMPPENVIKEILEKLDDEMLADVFSKLLDHTIEPPGGFFEKTIKAKPITSIEKPGLLFHLNKYRKIFAAAAVVAVIFFATIVLTRNNSVKDTAATVDAIDTSKNHIFANRDSFSHNESNKKPVIKTYFGKKRQELLTVKPQYLSFSSMNINGYLIPVYDNDPLLSFANYTPRSKRIYLRENESAEVTIAGNTNIAISKYMIDVINELYKVNKNGRPAWKAKRTKAKILRWRKEDAGLFNKKKKTNPLDLIDLADNVYN